MIREYIIALVIIAIVTAYILIPDKQSEPIPEPDDESAIPTAPEPQILATTTATTTEPEPIPEPDPLPPGVYCLEDCPLIDPDTVRAEVEDHFKDAPEMVAVAECESRFRQYHPETGEPLPNQQGSSAIGVFQIMRSYHKEPARAMGYDIETLEGQLGYAEYLYDTQGLRPWEASRGCWAPKIALGETPGNVHRDG